MNIAEILNNVQFLVDSEGNRKSVILDYRLWEQLIEPQSDQSQHLKEEIERLESELNAVKQSNAGFLSEIDMLKRLRNADKAEIRQYYESEISRLGTALQTIEELRHKQMFVSVASQVPKNFEGWSVRRDERGYLSVFKKISGKTKAAYVGKEWNENKARKAIADKLAKLAKLAVQTCRKKHQSPNGKKH